MIDIIYDNNDSRCDHNRSYLLYQVSKEVTCITDYIEYICVQYFVR